MGVLGVVLALTIGIFIYWVIGLVVCAWIHNTLYDHDMMDFSAFDTSDTEQMAGIALAALIWPVVVVAVGICGIGLVFFSFSKKVLTGTFERR